MSDKKIPLKGLTAFFFLLSTVTFAVRAEQMHSPSWAYSVDIPEGFRLTYKQADTSYQFEHDLFPLTLIIRSWPEDIPSGKKMKDVLKKLNAEGKAEDIMWRHRTCTLSFFDIHTKSGKNRGWAICVPSDKERGITLITGYAPESRFADLEAFIVSALDSFSPQSTNPNTSGIMSAFAYPAEGPLHTNIQIGKTAVRAEFDIADSKAHNALVEREYAILSRFLNTPFLEKAWQRYYRMIYRDAYKRLEKTAFNIYNSLETEISAKARTDLNLRRDNAANPPADKEKAHIRNNTDTLLAQTLLSWSQTLPYERRRSPSYFTGLIDTLSGAGSDCDSRALLLAVLMSHMNYNTMLFISPEYSHALFGIDIEGKGARLERDGVRYLLGETTAPVDIGLVPQDMSDSAKWFGIAGLGL